MTKVFEVKIGRTWSKVKATSIIKLSDWANSNNVSDWRMIGMQSRSEMENNKNLNLVG
jgi:hypothetical protein